MFQHPSRTVSQKFPGHVQILHGFSRNLGEVARQHVSKDQFSHLNKAKGLRTLQRPKGAT